MAKKICLDAGHYGKYNRSPVVSTYYESDMAWKLHRMLKAHLEDFGFEVITTRASQAKDLALTTRGRKAAGCDLFLSLHSNACDTESVDRPVAIYLYDDDCGKIDEESKKVAGVLAAVVEKVMQTREAAQTYSKKSSSDRDKDGKKNDDYYGVLYGAHQAGVAGIILEHSFHTNARAAKWLLNDANLNNLAKAEAEALAAYYGITKPAAAKDDSFLVKVLVDGLNIRKGVGLGNPVVGTITDHGTYTIVKTAKSSDGGTWGLLKAYRKEENGWINIGPKYVKKV